MADTPDLPDVPDPSPEPVTDADRQAHAEADLTAHTTRVLNRNRVLAMVGSMALGFTWVAAWLWLMSLVGDAADDLQATESFWYWPAALYELALMGVLMVCMARYLWPFLCIAAKQTWFYGLKLIGRYKGPVCDDCGGPHPSPERQPGSMKKYSLRATLTHPRHVAWRASELAMVVLGTYALTMTQGWDTTPAAAVCLAAWALEDVTAWAMWRAAEHDDAVEQLLPTKKPATDN